MSTSPEKTSPEKINPEAITEGLDEIKRQLQQITNDGFKISRDAKGESEHVRRIQSNVEKLSTDLQSLANNFVELSEKAECIRSERLKLDEECTNVLTEKVQLLEEERFVRAQLQVQEVEKKMAEEGKNLNAIETENERTLLEFAKEDMQKKNEDLVALEKRLEEKRIEYDKEWESFKDDVRRAREEKWPYLKSTQEFDNLVMSRFKGILRFSPEALNDAERNSAEATIQCIEINKELEEEREKLLDLEIEARDLYHATNDKFLERRALWKQYDCLQEEKRKLLPDDENVGALLRKTDRMENLLADPAELRDSLAFDRGYDETLLGGKVLHRCHKHTDISVPLSDAERSEFQSLLYDGEEESEQETDKLDVKVQDLCASTSSSEDKVQSDLQKDMAKNVLKQAEGNISEPVNLISKLQSRLTGISTRSSGTAVDAVSGATEASAGQRFISGLQRLKSDSRYKVDESFRRSKRK